jgi:hypothetical protein
MIRISVDMDAELPLDTFGSSQIVSPGFTPPLRKIPQAGVGIPGIYVGTAV